MQQKKEIVTKCIWVCCIFPLFFFFFMGRPTYFTVVVLIFVLSKLHLPVIKDCLKAVVLNKFQTCSVVVVFCIVFVSHA